MSQESLNPSKFVTKDDCSKITLETDSKINTVLKALVGDDLRGGLVKDVGDTKKDVADIKTTLKNNGNNNHNGGLGRKEKAIVYTALITSVSGTTGIIIVEALKYLH